ncbi:MAG: cyclic nucleotide-binding domain-containing protein [Rhodoferax sp.]|nr:cyclic nucleotide-binding domain-containing protein [Rhodoferax sp.]MCF8208295.1 cyclic nucleotide-binding domain-containing protein [Rhodoferax sp.]
MNRIKKIHVGPGVFWVEIPEVHLYVLCGCPPDSVKHMFRRGLIVPTEARGVVFETGPNVILLSDLMLQNGMFCNMAEFPVLQMLYRQGMAIPGHPNNTGAKPLIVGSRDQVDAQLAYIYRGNYGLVSEQELTEAGASPELAAEMMQMKLKFAFGKVRDSSDFLDTCIVGTDRVEIRDGVGLRRLKVNLYEFDFGDETLTVDLNLKLGDMFRSPISLGFHHVKREYFAVIHTGEGDGWDCERPSMSSILMFQGKIYLIDAGPTVIQVLEVLGISVNEIEGIFHTHSHDDHFAGLPALMRTDRRLKYYATPMVRASVSKKMCALLSMQESDLDHYFEICNLEFDTWNDVEGLEVRPILSPHPVETSIFQFRALWKDGFKVYAHYADIAALSVIDGMVRPDAASPGISPEFAERTKQAYLEPVDLKKLDVGGGMIHGSAEDFRGDTTKKIVLAHTSRSLDDTQKEIGSEAAFGTVDVLIPSFQDYGLRSAFGYLKEDFSMVPNSQFRMILNNETPVLNPGTIIIREGEINENIYLILGGYVEMIQASKNIKRQLVAGTMVGEISALREEPSRHTYRTTSYVHALKISAKLYRDFIRINKLHAQIERIQHGWNFLAETWLFGDGIPYTTLNRLAHGLGSTPYPAGYTFDLHDNRYLHMIKSGAIHRCHAGAPQAQLQMGDFFGEECVIGGELGDISFRVASDTEIYRIHADLLATVPICRWKLLEVSRRRALAT